MPRLLRLLLAALLVATPLSLTAVNAPPAQAAEPPRMVTTQLPVGTVGSFYSFQLEMTGGEGEITVLHADSVPAGMTVSPTGLFSGTPTTAGRGAMMYLTLRDEANSYGFAGLFFDVFKGDPGLRLSVSPTELTTWQYITVTPSTDHPAYTSPVQLVLHLETGERVPWCEGGCTGTLPRGTHVITAETTDTGNWNHETVEHTVVVTGRPTVITGNLVGNHMVVTGPDASIDATLTGIPGGATGTITFTSGEHVLATATLPLTGPVTLDLSALEAGYPPVRGHYSGDLWNEPAEFYLPRPFMVDPMQWVTPEALPDATYSLPYAIDLVTTAEDATFTLLPGSQLPNGMTFTADGRLTGTPEELGDFTLVVGGYYGVQQLTREFTLTVGKRLLDHDVRTSTAEVREGAGELTITVDPPAGTELDWAGLIVPAAFLDDPDPDNPPDPVCLITHPDTSCEVDVSDLPAGKYLVTAMPLWMPYGWELPEVPPLVNLQVTPHLDLVSSDLHLGAGQPGRIGLAAPLPADATGTVTVAVTPLGGGKRVPAPGEVLCTFDVTLADSCEIPADLTPGLYPLTVTYDGNYGTVTTAATLTVSVAPAPSVPPLVPADPPAATDPDAERPLTPTPAGAVEDAEEGAATATAVSAGPERDALQETGTTPWPLVAMAVSLGLCGAAVLRRGANEPL